MTLLASFSGFATRRPIHTNANMLLQRAFLSTFSKQKGNNSSLWRISFDHGSLDSNKIPTKVKERCLDWIAMNLEFPVLFHEVCQLTNLRQGYFQSLFLKLLTNSLLMTLEL